MPTTKPKRSKTESRKPARCCPRLVVLKADQYAELDALNKKRYDSLRDLEAIHDAWQQAVLDRDSVGFSSSYRATDSSRSTNQVDAALFAASQHPSPAPDWLLEATEALAGVARVGRLARFFWPPPFAAGTVVSQDGQQITVGGRGNSVAVCAWCREPAPSGRHENGRTMVSRVNDLAFHANGTPDCYRIAWRQAKAEGTTIINVVLARAREHDKAS